MEKAIYFIEVDGIKQYKCDTFWSKSPEVRHAKIHDDSKHDQDRFFKSLCDGFKPWGTPELLDSEFETFRKYEGSLYGYQEVLKVDDEFNGYSLLDGYELSEPKYIIQIKSISRKGEVESFDYKTMIERDLKIEKIIDNESKD